MADPNNRQGQPSRLPHRAASPCGEPQHLDQFLSRRQTPAPGQGTFNGLFDSFSTSIPPLDHFGEGGTTQREQTDPSGYQAPVFRDMHGSPQEPFHPTGRDYSNVQGVHSLLQGMSMCWPEADNLQPDLHVPAPLYHYTSGQQVAESTSAIDSDWVWLHLASTAPPANPENGNLYAPSPSSQACVPPTLTPHSAARDETSFFQGVNIWQTISGWALPDAPTGVAAQPGAWEPGPMVLSCAFKGCRQLFLGQRELWAHQNTHLSFLCDHGCDTAFGSTSALFRHNQTAHVDNPFKFVCGCGHPTLARRDNHHRHLEKCKKAAVEEFVCSCGFRTPDRKQHTKHFTNCKKPAGRPSGQQKPAH